jgi:hypothetical protein
MIQAFKKISQKKGYLYLFIKLACFLLLACFFDFLIGGVFHKFYFNQTSGWEYRTKYSIEDTKADILIFGASRAQQQYNPLYFEERLHQTCYNVGRDGEPIFYYYAVLKGILSRHIPKMIILDIENGVFKKSESSYDRISVLLPFYKTHPEMRSIIELRSPYEKIKLQSSIYPYNSMLLKIVKGNIKLGEKEKEDFNGYLPLLRSLNHPARTVDLSKPYRLDSNKLNCYKAFINDCNNANIKLYLVNSPYYFNSLGKDTSIEIAKDIAYKNSVDFIDLSRDEFFLKSPHLFDDTVHVNLAGSKIFTNKLIDSIISKK